MTRFRNVALMATRFFSLPLKSSCIAPVLQLCCIVQHVASDVVTVDLASVFFFFFFFM